MAVISKYHGLCETCDQDATCMLKRSSRLEIIHCEQYSTQPVLKKQNPVQDQAASDDASLNHGIEARGAKLESLADPV